MKSLGWGILGAGNIAGALAQALKQTDSGTAVAIASRNSGKAKDFAEKHGIPKAYGRYDDMLSDPDVDVVYVTTPHPMHAQWAIRCAEAGKHILCEKPMTMNWPDTMAVIDAASRHDVFLMEAFMYRCTPQTAKLVELIRSGAIGEVCMIDATFAFQGGWNPKSRLLNPKLGGGAILDVGCYTMSMARLIAGTALGREVAEPLQITGCARIGKTGVDEWAAATLKFEGDIIARLATGIQCGQDNKVIIYGRKGRIEVPAPWFCQGREAGKSTIIVNNEEIQITADRGIYANEADRVAICIDGRQGTAPAMSWADSLGQAKALDAWRAAIGLTYPADQPKAYAKPLNQRSLKVSQPCKMPYGEIAGVGKPISKLVMGTMAAGTIGQASAIYDAFFAAGGNAWDTAYVYRGGLAEKLLGQWIANRKIREQVVVTVKGAHSPLCDPENLIKQFHESLERLQLDYADLYFMHRDNPDIPVGDFVDAMNALKAKGVLKIFGGSNWSLKRINAANSYAAKNNLEGFSAVSNNFSLARMVNPLWGVNVTSSQPEYRQWHLKTQTPCFGWSAQARGFFDPRRASPRKHDPELEPYWYSPENFARQKRAVQLARRKGCDAMAIASAYCLAQKFPLFVMVGPATLEETASTLKALDIKLSNEEVQWLENG